MKINIWQNQAGQSLTEIIVAIGLIAIVFSGSFAVINNAYKSIFYQEKSLRAHYLVTEGIETAIAVRDEDWNLLTVGIWHFEYDESDPDNKFITVVSGSETIRGFTRSVEIKPVRRDPDTGKITENALIDYDDDTVEIEVVVTWNFKGKVIEDKENIYLTNWKRS